MAVNVKLGVDIGGFTSGIKQGQQILKGLNAEMKASEAEFKATGNAEQKLSTQTRTLNSQLNVQKGIADQARQALKAMTDQGIDPADAAYQKLYVQMLNAEAGANEAQAALNALGQGTEQAADGANKLSNSLNGISKKMSLEQVITGIDTITGGLERAAQKAIQLGENLFNAIMDSAQWADDTATQAQMYGIDLDTFMRMQKLVTNGLDTTVDAILTSQSKLNKGIGSESKATLQALDELHVRINQLKGDEGEGEFISRDQAEVFWEAGRAIMAMTDAYDQEAAAQALFGRSWKELIPLFTEFKSLKEYNEALEGVNVVSEDTVEDLATMNDKVNELLGNFETLKTEIVGALAPALTGAADALNGLLTKVLDYLETPEGKQALEDMGKAVEGLFSDLSSIDPEQVVEGFTAVFNTVVESIQWLSDNWEGAVTALEGIVAGWAVLKVTGGILDIVKVVQGIGGMTAGGAAAAGSAAGAAWGSSFASAVMTAAPWLIGLYTLLQVSPGGDKTGNNTLIDANGNLTPEAQAYGYELTENGELSRRAIVEQAAQDAWDLYRNGQMDAAALEALREKVLDNNAFADLVSLFYGKVQEGGDWKSLEDIDLTEWLKQFDGAPVEVEPVAPDNAAESLSEQIGTVYIPIQYDPTGRIRTPQGWVYPDGDHANGLPFVPYDGYLARLHKGERVMPAREVQSRNYSSNLYVESMYMNGGTDAAGLAAAMAAAQRRQMSGYGS